MDDSQITHVQILQACREGDAERVETLTREHIMQTARTLEPVLSQKLATQEAQNR
jgi:DNA-binding GntR family transcriptional regulator